MQLKQQSLTEKIISKDTLIGFSHKYRSITPPDGWRPEPLHALLCRLIQRAIESKHRIIISVPPQHGKSQIASVYAPAWYLLHNPERTVGLISYSSDLAETKSFQCRNLVREAFDHDLDKEAKSRKNWKLSTATTYNFIARGVGGGITGQSVDLLILDDLIKNHEEAESKSHRDKIWDYLQSTIMTRLSKDSAVIAILTRWHLDDYASRLHSKWHWPIYNIPAICEDPESDPLKRQKGEVAAPKLKPYDMIMQAKKDLSQYVFSSLYMGRPIGHETARIKREWFKYYWPHEEQEVRSYNVYQTVDTSATDSKSSDYFVVLTFAIITKTRDGVIIKSPQEYSLAQKSNKEFVKHIYILDVLKSRFETTDHQEALRLQREKWNPVCQYVENATFGLNIIQEAKKRGLPIEGIKADKSKFLRSEQISVYYKNGQVWHPKEADWLSDFEDEITTFPVAAHDDQFDAVSYAGIVAAKKKV